MQRRVLIPVRILFVSGLLMVLQGCPGRSRTQSATATRQDVVMPLQVGNTWDYFEVFPDGRSRAFWWTVRERYPTDGTEYFWVEQSGGKEGGRFLSNHPDGLYLHGAGDQLLDEPMLILRFPPHVGDRWENEFGASYEVTSLNEQVTVPAGTFECVWVKKNCPDGEHCYDKFYAIGIGLVKNVYYQNGQVEWSEELSGYHFEPEPS